MADPTLALQKALIAAMSGIGCTVYDAVPQGTAYPYVAIDRMTVMNNEYLSQPFDDVMVEMTIWSRARGRAQVITIYQAIRTALHHARITLDTGSVASITVDDFVADRDADNVTYMGFVTLRVFTSH